MLIDTQGQVWDEIEYETEDELEKIVFSHFELIFGDQSMLFGKSLIKTEEGTGTVPDAYVVNIEAKEWYLVEVELLRHGVYRHIVPQVTKQINAAIQANIKILLRQHFLETIKSNKAYLNLFVEMGVSNIEIPQYIEEILESDPIISIPIDRSSSDLESWANSLRFSVEIKELKTFMNRVDGRKIIEVPDQDQTKTIGGKDVEKTELYALFGSDLIQELVREELLKAGEKMVMTYKKQEFTAIITETGHLKVDDGTFKSATMAALYYAQRIKKDLKTINGLRMWRNGSGTRLNQLRKQLKKFST